MSAIAPARAPSRTPARPTGAATGARSAGTARATRPALRVVATPESAAGPGPLPFVLAVAGVLAVGLVALLMLHTLAAQDAFTLHKLQRQTAALGDVEQQLALANQQAQAPSTLAARAKALGMVPTGSLHIVRRRDGRIVAVASALPAPPPAATPAPNPSASASPGPAGTGAGTGRTAGSKPAGATTTSRTKPTQTKPSAKPHRPH